MHFQLPCNSGHQRPKTLSDFQEAVNFEMRNNNTYKLRAEEELSGKRTSESSIRDPFSPFYSVQSSSVSPIQNAPKKSKNLEKKRNAKNPRTTSEKFDSALPSIGFYAQNPTEQVYFYQQNPSSYPNNTLNIIPQF